VSVKRIAAVVPALYLCACSWFTDFKQQPKIDPWETAADTIAFRGNPQGSVPMYGSAAPGFMYDRTPSPQVVTTMANIANPVPADSASINRGRINFQINCAVCHGPLGQGNGNATKYGFPGIGIGAGSNAANNLSDGYIFGMIRNGRGLMPSYNRIEEPDRWDIINYLRSIQGKVGGVAADTTHCRPGETGAACVPSATRMGPTRPSPYFHATSVAGTQTGEQPTTGVAAPTSPMNPPVPDTARKKTPNDSTKKPEHEL
jgi:mono/diheme cytochrome c family protein